MIRDQRGRLPVHPTLTYDRRSLLGIQYLVIHHSGTPADASAEVIARYHVEHNGWPGSGYTFVVRQGGDVEQCWDLDIMSYGVAGRNAECLSICMVGDWSTVEPPEAQLRAAHLLCMNLQRTLRRTVPVVGHRDVALPSSATACPGNSWPRWRARVEA